MGGRGASSGTSNNGHIYGTDYKTIIKSGNIKFIKKNSNQSETIMETMTKGRVYVNINNKGKLTSITYFDKDNKRKKQIDLTHKHKKEIPHTHHGYIHNENDTEKGASKLTTKEKRMVDRINKIWYNYNNK